MSVNCQMLFKSYARVEAHLAHQLAQFIFRRDQEPPLVSSVCGEIAKPEAEVSIPC